MRIWRDQPDLEPETKTCSPKLESAHSTCCLVIVAGAGVESRLRCFLQQSSLFHVLFEKFLDSSSHNICIYVRIHICYIYNMYLYNSIQYDTSMVHSLSKTVGTVMP